jgi:PiT family inorganic phosphate transporter
MDVHPVALLAAAGAFAVVNGANDGGTLVATGLKIPAVRPLTAIGVLCACVAVVPLVLGTRVATTLTSRLVPFEGPEGRVAMLAGVLACVAVVTLLARRGLPTSLTLAVVGGFTGAGWGYGLAVSWGTVLQVLLLAAAAPFVGALLALLLVRAAHLVPDLVRAAVVVRRGHQGAYALQSVAYAANDGQKMIAVFAVAAGGTGTVPADPSHLAAIALLFGTGLVLGLDRYARTLSGGVLSLRPAHAVTAEFAASIAVLGTAALGVPVSMTQAVSAALVGSGVAETYRKIRWHEAGRIVAAWIVTLPAAFTAAALVAWIVKVVT